MFLLYLGSVLYLAAHSAAESLLCKQHIGHDNCALLPDDRRCGIASLYDDTSRIIGGRDAKRNDFPWVACLKAEISPECFCGGVLVSTIHILTAAHCVEDENQSNFWILLGEHDLRTDPDCDEDTGKCAASVQKYQPVKIVLHDQYEDYIDYDIAVVKMNRNVDVNPLNPQNPIQSILQVSTEFTTIRHEDCKKMPNFGPVTDRQICTKITNTRQPTRSDSGGPLMALNITTTGANKFDLIGLSSYIYLSDPPKAVYTRVTPYLGWILNNM